MWPIGTFTYSELLNHKIQVHPFYRLTMHMQGIKPFIYNLSKIIKAPQGTEVQLKAISELSKVPLGANRKLLIR